MVLLNQRISEHAHNISVSMRPHENTIVIKEEISKNVIVNYLRNIVKVTDSYFDLSKEYGVCNVISPFLNLRRYVVALEARIKNKQPDILAISSDFIVGRRYFYNPIFAPIMVFEIKSKPLNNGDITRLQEYVRIFHHVFLTINERAFSDTDKDLKKEINRLHVCGNLSLVLTYFGKDKLKVKYIINYDRYTLSNILACAMTLGKIIREEMFEEIKKKVEEGLKLHKYRTGFIERVQRFRVLTASLAEDALRRSRLMLMFPGSSIKDIYKRGAGLILSLITFASVFLTSPASSSIKYPHVFVFNEPLLSIAMGMDSIDDLVRKKWSRNSRK